MSCVCVCVCVLYVICYVCHLLRSKGKDSHLVLLVSCVLSLSLCVCVKYSHVLMIESGHLLPARCVVSGIAKGIQLMTIMCTSF